MGVAEGSERCRTSSARVGGGCACVRACLRGWVRACTRARVRGRSGVGAATRAGPAHRYGTTPSRPAPPAAHPPTHPPSLHRTHPPTHPPTLPACHPLAREGPPCVDHCSRVHLHHLPSQVVPHGGTHHAPLLVLQRQPRGGRRGRTCGPCALAGARQGGGVGVGGAGSPTHYVSTAWRTHARTLYPLALSMRTASAWLATAAPAVAAVTASKIASRESLNCK